MRGTVPPLNYTEIRLVGRPFFWLNMTNFAEKSKKKNNGAASVEPSFKNSGMPYPPHATHYKLLHDTLYTTHTIQYTLHTTHLISITPLHIIPQYIIPMHITPLHTTTTNQG